MNRTAAFAGIIAVLFMSGCAGVSDFPFGGEKDYVMSVHFADVGEGDCAYITLPDGKNMLIDCGEESEENFETVRGLISASGKETIDYLVITHPDDDHAGGAAALIAEYGAGKAFFPDILRAEYFPAFAAAKGAAEECGAETVISETFLCERGQDYFFVFLYPLGSGLSGSAYTDLNAAVTPTAEQINDVSAVIYLECAGVRFLFTGDAGGRAEALITEYYEAGIYGAMLKDRDITLENLDFYKAAHHGGADANGQEFLNLLRPANAVVSCGGGNYSGHPSTVVLERFMRANPEHNLYRTDTDGTVSVFIKESGGYYVKTEAEYGS